MVISKTCLLLAIIVGCINVSSAYKVIETRSAVNAGGGGMYIHGSTYAISGNGQLTAYRGQQNYHYYPKTYFRGDKWDEINKRWLSWYFIQKSAFASFLGWIAECGYDFCAYGHAYRDGDNVPYNTGDMGAGMLSLNANGGVRYQLIKEPITNFKMQAYNDYFFMKRTSVLKFSIYSKNGENFDLKGEVPPPTQHPSPFRMCSSERYGVDYKWLGGDNRQALLRPFIFAEDYSSVESLQAITVDMFHWHGYADGELDCRPGIILTKHYHTVTKQRGFRLYQEQGDKSWALTSSFDTDYDLGRFRMLTKNIVAVQARNLIEIWRISGQSWTKIDELTKDNPVYFYYNNGHLLTNREGVAQVANVYVLQFKSPLGASVCTVSTDDASNKILTYRVPEDVDTLDESLNWLDCPGVEVSDLETGPTKIVIESEADKSVTLKTAVSGLFNFSSYPGVIEFKLSGITIDHEVHDKPLIVMEGAAKYVGISSTTISLSSESSNVDGIFRVTDGAKLELVHSNIRSDSASQQQPAIIIHSSSFILHDTGFDGFMGPPVHLEDGKELDIENSHMNGCEFRTSRSCNGISMITMKYSA
jgi:hypothetical protein